MKTNKFLSLSMGALALGGAILLPSSSQAVDSQPKLNATDARYLQDESAAGAAMVKMAQLGEKKALREETRSFAGMLVNDHTKANVELVSLAAAKGVELTGLRVEKDVSMQMNMEQVRAEDFDKQFLVLMIRGHEACVKNSKRASIDAVDNDVKALAEKMLPSQQMHLVKAKELSSELIAKEGSVPANPAIPQPDNTARNVRDRDPESITPIDQGNSKADIDRTAQIRREILDLKGISVNAKNIKVITNNGHVTLRGPVDSENEKRMIGEIAARIATSEHMDNQLEVRKLGASN
jgi:predicted outer membrane protein